MLDEGEWASVWNELYYRPMTSPVARVAWRPAASREEFMAHREELRAGRQYMKPLRGCAKPTQMRSIIIA
jgi:hypothetical protein